MSRVSSEARIPLHYAEELSLAASSFGARTRREARNYPGTFNRPVVGHDPYYYKRAAGKVLHRAVKADPVLKGLYQHAWSLSSSLEQATNSPYYDVTGPSVEKARELTDITAAIQICLVEKELRLPLQGKPLARALDISAFAIRVIEGSQSYSLLMDRDYRGLYPGLPADLPVNTVDYWQGLQEQLAMPATV